MNPVPDTVLVPRSERPTLIEGLRPRSARPADPRAETPHAHASAGIHARCLACGATASDWRRLLGVGARLADCAVDASRIVLDYPMACAACGSSEVLVSAA